MAPITTKTTIVGGRADCRQMISSGLTAITHAGLITAVTTTGNKSRAWKNACATSWRITTFQAMCRLARSPATAVATTGITTGTTVQAGAAGCRQTISSALTAITRVG